MTNARRVRLHGGRRDQPRDISGWENILLTSVAAPWGGTKSVDDSKLPVSPSLTTCGISQKPFRRKRTTPEPDWPSNDRVGDISKGIAALTAAMQEVAA